MMKIHASTVWRRFIPWLRRGLMPLRCGAQEGSAATAKTFGQPAPTQQLQQQPQPVFTAAPVVAAPAAPAAAAPPPQQPAALPAVALSTGVGLRPPSGPSAPMTSGAL